MAKVTNFVVGLEPPVLDLAANKNVIGIKW